MEPKDEMENLEDGLRQMQALNTAFLASGQGSEPVRMFLENSQSDDALLVRFLRGRKYKPKYAWETLKRHAEVQSDVYPELFPNTLSENVQNLLKHSQIFGVLKACDSLGRRIVFFNTAAWDPDMYAEEEITTGIVHLTKKLIEDEDCLENGLVFIQDCRGSEMKHAKVFSIRAVRRSINVFWQSFPLQVKEVYFVNLPYMLTCIFRMVSAFFPRKLKERCIVSAKTLVDINLQHCISPKILPKCLGGEVEFEDAVDKYFATYSLDE